MPGAERVTLDRLAAHAGQAAELGIPMVALFPATPAELKDADGTEALKPNNLICQAARLLKREFPGVGLARARSVRRADLRLPGFRRVRDEHGRGAERLAGP